MGDIQTILSPCSGNSTDMNFSLSITNIVYKELLNQKITCLSNIRKIQYTSYDFVTTCHGIKGKMNQPGAAAGSPCSRAHLSRKTETKERVGKKISWKNRKESKLSHVTSVPHVTRKPVLQCQERKNST